MLVMLLSLTGCSREDIDFLMVSHRWKVIKFKEKGALQYQKPSKDYIITFESDSLYALLLDVNLCNGTYALTGSDKISFKTPGCTYVCCDSEIAMKLPRLLPKMTEYYGRGGDLVLKGDGKIYLSPVR